MKETLIVLAAVACGIGVYQWDKSRKRQGHPGLLDRFKKKDCDCKKKSAGQPASEPKPKPADAPAAPAPVLVEASAPEEPLSRVGTGRPGHRRPGRTIGVFTGNGAAAVNANLNFG